MLNRDQIEQYERSLMKEIANRQQLGAYSPDAPTILFLCQMCFELIRHLKEKMPAPKAKRAADDDA
jgi:hypothetical protein